MGVLTALRPRGGDPLSAIVSGGGDVRRRAGSSAGRLAALAAIAFRREPVASLAISSSDPAERWRVACETYAVDAVAAQDATYKTALLYLAIMIALSAIDIATWHSYVSSWLAVIGHVSPLAPALALSMRASFANWQARTRRLGGLREFARSPGAWWPEPAAATGRGAAATVIVGGLLVAGTIAGTAPAHAADGATTTAAGLFTALPPGDLWGHLLTFVFPSVGPVGGEVTPIAAGIADAFSAMLAILMGLSAAVMSFQIVQGVAATAHEGSVLGKRWNTMWAPLRVCYGFASLAPVVKGYCLLQVLVVWVGVASGQLGNAMWTGFVTGLTAPTLSAPNLPETTPLVRALLRTEVCFAEEQQVASDYGVTPPTWPTTYTTGSTIGTVASGSWSYVSSWWSSSPRDTDPVSLQNLIWDYGPCGQVSMTSSPTASGALGVLSKAQATAVDTLRGVLKTQAEAIVRTTLGAAAGTDASTIATAFAQVVAAKNAYDVFLQDANNVFVSTQGQASFADFQSAATTAGWVSAGPYYMTIARINSSVADATKALPSVDASSYSPNVLRGPLHDELYSGPSPIMETVDAWWDKSISAPAAGGLSVAAASAGTLRQGGIRGTLKGALSSDSWLQKHAMAAVALDPSSFDGLQQVVSEGDYIVGIGEVLVGADLLKKIAPYLAGPEALAAAKAESALGGGDGLTWTQVVTGSAGLTLLGAGVYESLILPMLPAIHFLFAVVGILVVLVEGVCAAPLWAFAHIRVDGEDLLSPAQRTGYTVLMQVFFRIPLTLLGLFFSLLVFDGAVWLLSVTLAPAMASATTESLYGVVSTIVYMVLTGVMSYALANRSFQLITALPDGVLRWLGAGGENSAGEAQHATALVGLVQRAISSAPTPGRKGSDRSKPTPPGPDPQGGDEETEAVATGSVRPLEATGGV